MWHTIIAEHSPKIADNIDDKEDRTLLRLHGKIASFSISRYRMTIGSFHKEIIDFAGTAKIDVGRIRRESEEEDDDENHDSVHVVGQKGSFETAKDSVPITH